VQYVLSVSHPKISRLKYKELQFCHLFCMGVKLCLSHRLRVFGNRLLRKIFGPKRDEVAGEWRSGGVHDLYSTPNIIRVIKSR